MPPPEHDQDSFEVVTIAGTPIDDDDLPFAKDRKISDMGPHMAPMLFKRAEDTLDYSIPLGRFLEPDEFVTGVTVSHGPQTSPPLIIPRVGYAPNGICIWITAGGDDERYMVHATITTSQGRTKLFRFIMRTRGIADYEEAIYVTIEPIIVGVGLVPGNLPTASVSDGTLGALPEASVSDGTLGDGVVPDASVSDGELSDGDAAALAGISPTSANLTEEIGLTASRVLTLTNSGDAAMTIESITASTGFAQTNNCGSSLSPGATCSITVTHTPSAAGSMAGTVNVATSGGNVTTTLLGIGNEPEEVSAFTPLRTIGNQFVDANDMPVRLRSVNWFGAEGTNNFPHGIWMNGYKILVDKIVDWGFNCIRIPFSGDTFKAGQVINGVDGAFPENHDFITGGVAPNYTYVTPSIAMDTIINYAAEKGLYVVLDHHRRHAGNGADGGPTDASYNKAQWLATWTTVATRYKNFPNVVGADVHNEPHDLDWATWAGLAEECGNHIHAIAPHWVIFVEGVGHIDDDHYWWGGQLAGVRTRPVSLTVSNKLAYSPHEYGQSVGSQTWLRYDSAPTLPANYPNNLRQVWKDHWGFIFEENIAPIWIGEFGGHYGLDGAAVSNKPHGTYERQWTTELGKYLGGDFLGTGVNQLTSGKLGASFAYWSFNPNSGDTGGLLQDDWDTAQSTKLTLLAPFLA